MATTTNSRPAPHRNLSRLQIPSSTSPSPQQQPVTLDGQPLFRTQSPVTAAFHPAALPLANGPPTATYNPFPFHQQQNMGLNTPNPGLFNPNGPPNPNNFNVNTGPGVGIGMGLPMGHRSRQSMALPNLAALNMNAINPANIPIPPTPGGAGGPGMQFNPAFFPNGMPSPMLRGPGMMHSRRTQSVSLGGPPKAVLGGPKRAPPTDAARATPPPLSLSLAPPTANGGADSLPTPGLTPTQASIGRSAAPAESSSAAAMPPTETPPAPVAAPLKVNGKMKKCTVRLPREVSVSSSSSETKGPLSPLWVRNPVRRPVDADGDAPLASLDVSTGEIFSVAVAEALEVHQQQTNIEVFLPTKESWAAYKNAIIEEKLARLGVEPGLQQQFEQAVGIASPSVISSFNLSHSHGRAASISSPADPALLHFKLNKLHNQSAGQSNLSQSSFSSPHTPLGDFEGGANSGMSQGASPYGRPPGRASGHMQTMSLANPSGSYFPGMGMNISPGQGQGMNGMLPRLSPFGGSTTSLNSNPDAPVHNNAFVPLSLRLNRSPLPASGLRSVSETEDEDDVSGDGEQLAERTEEDEEEDDDDVPLARRKLFAPQPTTPIRHDAFAEVQAQALSAVSAPSTLSQSASAQFGLAAQQARAASAGPPPVPAKDDQPNFAVGFGLDDESDYEEFSFAQEGAGEKQTQSPQEYLDLAEFGQPVAHSTPAVSNALRSTTTAATQSRAQPPSMQRQGSTILGAMNAFFSGMNGLAGSETAESEGGDYTGDDGEEVDGDDDVETVPAHSRHTSQAQNGLGRAISAVLNQPPPRAHGQHPLGQVSEAPAVKDMATQLAEVRRSAAQPSAPVEAHQQQREERESSAVPSQTTDEEYEYAGGDEKENIPPQPQARSSEVSPHRTPQGPMLHGDLHGDLAPASSSTPPAQTQVFGESLAVPTQQTDDEDWTNPSQLRGLSEHDLSPGHVLGHAHAHGDDADMWTGSEVTGEEYMDAEELEHSDNESAGEWSNPSDEEREREARRLRRQNPQLRGVNHVATSSLGSAFGPSTNNAGAHLDDEIISNPSEEGGDEHPSHYFSGTADGPSEYFSPARLGSDAGGSSGRAYRPLPLPPSSTASPAPNATQSGSHSRSASLAGRERLNPLAKPFVFGGAALAGVLAKDGGSVGSASPRSATRSFTPKPAHSRTGSIVKLNAAAAEFKPSFLSSTSFNFRPPPGMPSLAFPEPAAVAQARSPRPLPVPPLPSTSPPPTRATQGREKRQRRVDSLDFGDTPDTSQADAIGDSVPLFEFPPDWPATTAELVAESNAEVKREPMPRRKSVLNPAAKPFTFSGSGTPTVAPAQMTTTSTSAPATVPGSVRSVGSKRTADGMEDAEEEGEHGVSPSDLETLDTPLRSPEGGVKGRRPPIPDFRHPVSTKTVPASVFKALSSADADSATRPTVRSRLSSREKNMFMESHGRQGSLDDINLPLIARRSNLQSSVLQPKEASPFGSVVDDVFTQSPEVNQLNISFNPSSSNRLRPARPSTGLSSSSGHDHWAKPAEDVALDSGLLDVLDDKFRGLRQELISQHGEISSSEIRAALTDFIPVLNLQLQQQLEKHRELNAGNESLGESKAELDYEHIHNIIADGHHELRASLQRDIAELAQALEHQSGPHSVYPLVDEMHKEVISSLKGATSSILSHFDASDESARRRPVEERQKLLQELLHVLVPHINTLKAEPFDIDRVTLRVSEAVKPHISQLIDLASDKKETAGLILDHLVPVLARLSPQPQDYEELTGRISTELRAAVAQIDAHTIKEAVADLVVERLDARLANRENLSEHLEELATRISASLAPSLEHSEKLSLAQDRVSTHIDEILGRHDTLLSNQTELNGKLLSIPDILTAASATLAQAQVELVAKSQALNEMQDIQEVVKAHVQLQIELGDAKATIPQLVAEKNILANRVAQLEAEGEARKAEIDRLLTSVSSQDALVAQADARVAEIEKVKAEAEAKYQAAAASAQAKDHHIESLQSDNHTLQSDSKELQSKLLDAEKQIQLSQQALAAAEQAKRDLTVQRNELAGQQDHWKAIQKTAEQVNVLSKLFQEKTQKESEDLKKFRDRSNVLEGELTALQKVSAGQEKKIAELQKASAGSKHTILNAQLRASEWEKKHNERQTELDEQRRLVADASASRDSSAKEIETLNTRLAQMEESERATSEREIQLKNRVSSLDSQLQAMKAELEKARAEATTSSAARSYPTPRSSLTRAVSRPGSAGSNLRHESLPSPEEDDDDARTEREASPEPEGIWGSMHAPSRKPSVPAYAPSNMNRAPSFTPSTPRPAPAVARRSFRAPAHVSPALTSVSLALTQGDDGWWS